MASVYFAICCVQSLPVHVRDEEYRQLKDVKQIRFCWNVPNQISYFWEGRVSKGYNNPNTILGHFIVFLLAGKIGTDYGVKSKNQVK